jgi:hypothetical protein
MRRAVAKIAWSTFAVATIAMLATAHYAPDWSYPAMVAQWLSIAVIWRAR